MFTDTIIEETEKSLPPILTPLRHPILTAVKGDNALSAKLTTKIQGYFEEGYA